MTQKILFIGDGFPVGQDIGSIFYYTIMHNYGLNKFCYFSLRKKGVSELPEEFKKINSDYGSLRIFPREKKIYIIIKRIPLIEELFYFILYPGVIKKLIRFINLNKVDIIVAVFRSDVLSVVNHISYKCKLPLVGYVSDTVEAEFKDKKIIYMFKRSQYYKALKNATAIYVASEAMKSYIEKEFGTQTVILRLGFSKYKKTNQSHKGKINIIFAGSLYAIKEFNTFLKSLSDFANKHKEYLITLYVASNIAISLKCFGVQIVELGWLNEETLSDIMKTCVLGYIPYKFDENYKTQVKYAFPSKIGLYISNGLPLFFHGPQYSSVKHFLDKYKCGIHCMSMNQNEIVVDLETVLLNKKLQQLYSQNTKIAYEKEFAMEIMNNRFSKLIAIVRNRNALV